MYPFADVGLFQTTPVHASGRSLIEQMRSVKVVERIPPTFSIGLVLFADMVAVFMAIQIYFALRYAPVTTFITVEGTFLATVALFALTRMLRSFTQIYILCIAILLISSLLNAMLPNSWGDYGLLVLCCAALYRFPLSWSLPLAGLSVLFLITTHGVEHLFLHLHFADIAPFLTLLLITFFLCWIGWMRRGQYLLIVRLQEVQERLQAEKERAEELAIARERTRIARDIHDVLAHSLSVLSIQVQAARGLIARDPARLSIKLDDMAEILRESMAESSHIIGLLRDTPPSPAAQMAIGAQLQEETVRFRERTGIHCLFQEDGTPFPLAREQEEALQYALREALTNAYRHGAAHTIWASLHWQLEGLTLQIRDDGSTTADASTLSPDQLRNDTKFSSHHGLQGMRERSTALGGTLKAEPLAQGGFSVKLHLPLKSPLPPELLELRAIERSDRRNDSRCNRR